MGEIIFKLEDMIWGVPLIVILMFTHIYFTFKLKFPQKFTFKGLKLIVKGDKKNKDQGISSYKSLMTILAGTLGTGNIIGISAAITIGGIGSIFWIFISGVFAIATKYAETYIVLKYRKYKNGASYGGTMYVLKDRIGNIFLATLFSIFILVASLGMGSMIQSNSITATILENFDINKTFISICITIICAYAIFGSEKRISDISSILVPIATIVYLYMCGYLLYMFKDNILNSIFSIINAAFDFRSITGGILGTSAMIALRQGLSKGLFTNEAGMGSSPIFDSTVRETNIKKQSIISSTSVFIDTVVLCTLTGIVIVASGLYQNYSDPITLMQQVFSNIPYGNYLLSFSLVAFAFATIPCWSYYGKIAVNYLFKEKTFYQLLYKLAYLVFVYCGSRVTVTQVWSIANISTALMSIPNIYMLYYLRKEIE